VTHLLDNHGITDRIDRRQKLAALKRAYDQAVS
jgi:hypothetical protein